MREVGTQCTPGHEKRCREADSPTCNCACGGVNHGNPAAWPGPKATDVMADELDGPYQRTLISDRPPRAAKILFLRYRDGHANVVVHHHGIDRKIPHKYDVHSPTGMEFGYSGSGPADLALNILAMFVPPPTAYRLHQVFKYEFLTDAEEGDELEVETILNWIKENW